MQHTLSVLVENSPGVLARVAGLVSRRGFNIESLAVGPTEQDDRSRITLRVDASQHSIDQVIKQLYKLINVLKVNEMTADDAIERELMIVRVAAQPNERADLIRLAEVFSASRIRSARSVGCAATRTIISSRSIASSDVISFTFSTLISL